MRLTILLWIFSNLSILESYEANINYKSIIDELMTDDSKDQITGIISSYKNNEKNNYNNDNDGGGEEDDDDDDDNFKKNDYSELVKANNDFHSPFSLTNYRRQQQQQQQKQQQQQHQYQRQEQYQDGVSYTREFQIKQGRLKGIVKQMHPQSGLINVDQFLGLPYAEAPIGNKRFMPPGAPPLWKGLRIAGRLPAVCPQNLPKLNNTNNKYSRGRFEQLERLLPYLKIENEDCLYLNLYVPNWEGLRQAPKFPVIIYIHGESYEWNSGNPYDGSVLASYGQVIVVTLNYRLGILGFMKPGLNGQTVANYGLMDIIAALQWIKDNIAAFGGDPKCITLMGHNTGAACVNFMMISPIAKGLFHRAILMSGSALSDWATTNHPLQATTQIAQNLNCPLNDEEMTECLRKIRYSEILKTKPKIPEFSTPFGPIIDNLVVKPPHKVMGENHDTFRSYDLLFGVTEIESYHNLNAIALAHGLLERERDTILRYYMQNRFELRPSLALAATLREYTDVYSDPNKALADEHRDTLLEILSDARVVAPLIQTGIYHAKVNPRNYMYVFGHNSEAGEYAHLSQSVVGEELAYVFGAPLLNQGPFQKYYNMQERLLSEAVMKYWTNFAKTGNPKAPWKGKFLYMNPKDWKYYDIDWPEFYGKNQSYMNLGIPPAVKTQYRQKYMKFWNQHLPEELKKSSTNKGPYADIFTPVPSIPNRGTLTYPDGQFKMYPGRKTDQQTENPYRALQILLSDPVDGPYNVHSNHITTSTENVLTESKEVVSSGSPFYILVGIVTLFFILNFVFLSAYVWKKKIKNRILKRGFIDPNVDGTTDDDIKRSKLNETDDSFIMDIVRKTGTNTYEPVKTSYSPINGFKLARQSSTSTVDPHTKVCDWIAQEITKYSPKIQKKIHSASSLSPKNFLSRPKKVSVAIDATPSGRSDSVLRQEPIEITKAKSFDRPNSNDIMICRETDCETDDVSSSMQDANRRSSSTSGLDFVDGYKIEHKHSNSDPVDMYPYYKKHNENVTSFIEDEDINVTSRDEYEPKEPLSPEETLKTIQRRNYPRVLPDYPEEDEMTTTMKRRSLPAHTLLQYNQNLQFLNNNKIPPMPPPRTSSTLGRRSSSRRRSNNITTSPLMLAEEPPDVQEPEISLNTLHVGPLIPKINDGIYSTFRKNKSLPDTSKLINQYHTENNINPIIYETVKPKIIIKPSYGKQQQINEKRTNIPRVQLSQNSPLANTICSSKIPTLKQISHINNNTKQITEFSDSSSSNETSSSTGTVRKNT